MKKLILVLLLLITTNVYARQDVSEPLKFALVIGNVDYSNGIAPLPNAGNDARKMKEALERLGFDVVIVTDRDRDQMESDIQKLSDRLSKAKNSNGKNNSYGFFFFAGHGFQEAGVQYLLPVNYKIPEKDTQIPLNSRAVSLNFIRNTLYDAGNTLNIIVLDACRSIIEPRRTMLEESRHLAESPIPVSIQDVITEVTLESMLKNIDNDIIVYASGNGYSAYEGFGTNSRFTSKLLKYLDPTINSKNIYREVNDLFTLTRAELQKESKLLEPDRRQNAEIHGIFAGKAYLGRRPPSNHEFFLGYSLMKADEYNNMDKAQDFFQYHTINNTSTSSLLKKGGVFSYTYNFGISNISFGLEASVRFNTDHVYSASNEIGDDTYTLGLKRNDFALLGGPHVTFMRNRRVIPFVHGLVGFSRDSLAFTGDGENRYKEQYSELLKGNTSFAIAMGGGLDIKIGKDWAVRAIQVDYYLTDHPSQPLIYDIENKRFKNINMAFGLVYRFRNAD